MRGYVETLCGDHWWFWPLLNYKRRHWCRPHCLFTHQSANPGVTTRDCCAAKQPIETQKISPHQDLVPTCCLHFSNAYETHLRDQFPPQWARSAPWQRPTQSLQALETEDLQTSKDEVRSTVIEALGSSGLYVDPSFIRNWRQPSTPQVPGCLIIHALLNFVIHWWISKHVELIWQKYAEKMFNDAPMMLRDRSVWSHHSSFFDSVWDFVLGKWKSKVWIPGLADPNHQIADLRFRKFWREKLWDKMKNIWKQENTPKGQRQQPWNSGSALQPKDWCPPKCFAKAKTFQIICTQKQEGKSYLGVFARNQEDYCHLVQATWLESLLHTRQIQSTRSNKSTEYNLLTSHDPHGMYKFHQIKDPLFQAMPSSVHIH